MAKRPRRRPAADNDADRVLDAVLQLVPVEGWAPLTMRQVARAAGLTLPELMALYPSKQALLTAFSRRIDIAVAQALDPDSDPAASARDRLFEVVMARFDALLPHKEAVRTMFHDLRRDPAGTVCAMAALRRSSAWMLECAGLSSSGLAGEIRLQGLAAISAATFRVWLGDDSEDMARTMAALDRRLACAERTVRRACGFAARGPRAAAAAQP